MLFSPQDHASNPPSTWQVVKAADRTWHLTTSTGGVLDSYPSKSAALADKESGPLVSLYEQEARWIAGATIPNWRPFAECFPDFHAPTPPLCDACDERYPDSPRNPDLCSGCCR